jgi:thiamine-monophosphate kinase
MDVILQVDRVSRWLSFNLGVGISKKISISFLDQLYKGIHKACMFYNVELFGGDTVSSPKSFFINITILGEAKRGKLFTRKGAKKGDMIFTTGTLGDSSLGLKILSNKQSKCSSKSRKYLLKKHLDPTPRLKESHLLTRSTCKITSMIDISDGLAQDLQHICRQSKTGALIYEEKLPQSQAFSKVCSENNWSTLPLSLNGGEDYELIFSVPSKKKKSFKKNNFLNPKLTKIGRFTKEKRMKIYDLNFKSLKFKKIGYSHF